MVTLVNKDFKEAIIDMYKKLKKNMIKIKDKENVKRNLLGLKNTNIHRVGILSLLFYHHFIIILLCVDLLNSDIRMKQYLYKYFSISLFLEDFN